MRTRARLLVFAAAIGLPEGSSTVPLVAVARVSVHSIVLSGSSRNSRRSTSTPEMAAVKVYFAGPLFSAAERAWNAELAAAIRNGGHEVFLPQDKERGLDAAAIFTTDVGGIDWADALVAIMDGPDPDAGTAWEVGYAYGNTIDATPSRYLVEAYRRQAELLGRVEHQRVLGQAPLIEHGQQLAASFIEPLAHRPVPRHVNRLRLLNVLLEQAPGRVMR